MPASGVPLRAVRTQEICGRALTPNTPAERTTYLSAQTHPLTHPTPK